MDEKYEGCIGRVDGAFLGCDCTVISRRIEVCTVIEIPLSFVLFCTPFDHCVSNEFRSSETHMADNAEGC